MDSRKGLQAVLEVRDRLQRKFFHVQAAEVARTVDEVPHEFDGHPVRDFVPVLVERVAATGWAGCRPSARRRRSDRSEPHRLEAVASPAPSRGGNGEWWPTGTPSRRPMAASTLGSTARRTPVAGAGRMEPVDREHLVRAVHEQRAHHRGQ